METCSLCQARLDLIEHNHPAFQSANQPAARVTFDDLPAEVLSMIAQELVAPRQLRTLCNLALTSRRCYQAASEALSKIYPTSKAYRKWLYAPRLIAQDWALKGMSTDPHDHITHAELSAYDIPGIRSLSELPQLKYVSISGKERDLRDMFSTIKPLPVMFDFDLLARAPFGYTMLSDLLHFLDLIRVPGFRMRSLTLEIVNLQEYTAPHFPWPSAIQNLVRYPPFGLSHLTIKLKAIGRKKSGIAIPIPDSVVLAGGLVELRIEQVPWFDMEICDVDFLRWLLGYASMANLQVLHIGLALNSTALSYLAGYLTSPSFKSLRQLTLCLTSDEPAGLSTTQIPALTSPLGSGASHLSRLSPYLRSVDLVGQHSDGRWKEWNTVKPSFISSVREALPHLRELKLCVDRDSSEWLPILSIWSSLRKLTLQLVTSPTLLRGVCPCRVASSDPMAEELHEAMHMVFISANLGRFLFHTIFAAPAQDCVLTIESQFQGLGFEPLPGDPNAFANQVRCACRGMICHVGRTLTVYEDRHGMQSHRCLRGWVPDRLPTAQQFKQIPILAEAAAIWTLKVVDFVDKEAWFREMSSLPASLIHQRFLDNLELGVQSS